MDGLNIASKIISVILFLVVVGLVWRLWSRQDSATIPGKASSKPAGTEDLTDKPIDK